jgi:[acyl-carrier-protein] S-malonyltransferase
VNSVTSSIAIAFPGQGVTPESFRRSLLRLDRHPYVERLGRLLGVDDWSAPDLVDPLIAQPALLACSLALADEIAATRDLGAAAGHSLGEIAAFTFAGAIEFEDALDLVRTRAKCCQAAAKANGGRMLSVMGLDRAQVEWVRRTVIARGGVVEVAVQNAPREWVLSGDDAAIRESAAMVRAASARTRRLAIEGAFHDAQAPGGFLGGRVYLHLRQRPSDPARALAPSARVVAQRPRCLG